MKKTKVLTQYSNNYFSISITVEVTGNVRKRSTINFKGKDKKEKYKKWYENNKEIKRKVVKEYYKNNKEISIQRVRTYRKKNKKQIQRKYKKHYQINKEIILKNKREYYHINKEDILQNNKQYRKDNPEKVKIWDAKHSASRKKFGYDPINEWFKDCNFHHLHIDDNHNIGIHIPAEIHKSVWHSNKDKESMNKINNLAFEWLKNNRDC